MEDKTKEFKDEVVPVISKLHELAKKHGLGYVLCLNYADKSISYSARVFPDEYHDERIGMLSDFMEAQPENLSSAHFFLQIIQNERKR